MSDTDKTQGIQSDVLSSAIEKIMANPQLISTVVSALGGLNSPPKISDDAESSGQVSQDAEQEISAAPTSSQGHSSPDMGEMLSSLAPMLSQIRGNPKGKDDDACRREALLCALKPYVSQGRREAIDYIIRISKISDMLKHIN